MAAGLSSASTTELMGDRPSLERASTAERVAAVLRTRIMEGLFPPGTRLPEDTIGEALGISRNTLREAFRLLCHERLAVHQLNRGVFVAVLSADDVVDIYRLRRLLEVGALESSLPSPGAVATVRLAVEEAEAAADAGDWWKVATADLRFHQAITALAGSQRLDDIMRRALAELRLAFHVMADPERFHRPYLARNRTIADLIAAELRTEAQGELIAYLADAEQELLAAYAEPD